MGKVICFKDSLDIFKNLVLVYKNENGEMFLGSSSHNNHADDIHKNSIVLYKDSMPNDKDFIMGWNYLDDHSSKIYLVYNEHSEVAVDDFLAAHNINKTWKDIEYHVVDSINDINDILTNDSLTNNEVRAYGTLE